MSDPASSQPRVHCPHCGKRFRVEGTRVVENPEGLVGTYVHHNQTLGVLVSITTSAGVADAAETLKSVCMHAEAMKPTVARREDISAADVEREKAIY
ncbi:MAG: hypothetical protein ACC662_10240, partial [Planctomycetota bacterium]